MARSLALLLARAIVLGGKTIIVAVDLAAFVVVPQLTAVIALEFTLDEQTTEPENHTHCEHCGNEYDFAIGHCVKRACT